MWPTLSRRQDRKGAKASGPSCLKTLLEKMCSDYNIADTYELQLSLLGLQITQSLFLIHMSTHQSHLLIHLCQSTQLPIYPPTIYSSINPPIYLPTHLSIHPPTYSSTHPSTSTRHHSFIISIHPFTHLFSHPTVYSPAIPTFILLSIQPANQSFLYIFYV